MEWFLLLLFLGLIIYLPIKLIYVIYKFLKDLKSDNTAEVIPNCHVQNAKTKARIHASDGCSGDEIMDLVLGQAEIKSKNIQHEDLNTKKFFHISEKVNEQPAPKYSPRAQKISHIYDGSNASFHISDEELNELFPESEHFPVCDGDYNKITREIIIRKIKYLIHFTSMENLESILTFGFIPRADLEMTKHSYGFNDSLRLDGRKDCTCFSVEYPNEFFMKKFKSKSLCVLQLNIKKVFEEHNGKMYYTIFNSATKVCRDLLKSTPDALSTYDAFVDLFQENNPDTRHKYTRSEKKIKSYLPTNPQSEVLITDTITPKFINTIHFRNVANFNEFKIILNDVTLLKKFSLEVNDFYFKSRDGICWENR